jgi:hypothetical protein
LLGGLARVLAVGCRLFQFTGQALELLSCLLLLLRRCVEVPLGERVFGLLGIVRV